MDAERDRRPLGFEMSDGHVLVCRFEWVICMVWIVNVCPCKSEELATGVTMRFFCAPHKGFQLDCCAEAFQICALA